MDLDGHYGNELSPFLEKKKPDKNSILNFSSDRHPNEHN